MNNIKAFAEKHGTLLAIILGGVGIVVTIIVAGKITSGSSNNTPSVLTDAAGNPITGGAQVSPTMSNADISTLLQDMEQQILNWEQNQGSSGGGNTGGVGGINPPPGDVGGWSLNTALGEYIWHPGNIFIRPGTIPPQPSSGPNGASGQSFWDNTIGAWIWKFMAINPPSPTPPPLPGNNPPQVSPGAGGDVFARARTFPGPLSTVWSFWQNYGQKAGISWSAYQKDFADWNGVKNINLIYAGKQYRVA